MQLFDTFFDLLSIPSPTFSERRAADYIKSALTELGLSVYEDDSALKTGSNSGNIIAKLAANSPQRRKIFFCCHMDTVPYNGTIRPQFDGSRFTSDGTTILGADDKAGIAPLLDAVRTVVSENLSHGDLYFIFTTAEEGGLLGVKHLDLSMIDADFGYCLDSSGDTGRLIMKGCGENEISITITGRAAHAGIAPEEGINAIVAASRAISTLRDGRLDADTTINVGTITGGTASNIVPDFAEIVIDARSTAKLKLATLTRYISEHFTHHAANNDAQCSVKIESAFKPYELYENDAVVKTALAAFADCKLTPKLTASGGGSDANLLNEKFPCAVLGIGVRHAHTNGEYIDASDLITTKNIILALIKEA